MLNDLKNNLDRIDKLKQIKRSIHYNRSEGVKELISNLADE